MEAQHADAQQSSKESELGPTEFREERDTEPTEDGAQARENRDKGKVPAAESAAEDPLAEHVAAPDVPASKTKEGPLTQTHEDDETGDATAEELAAYNNLAALRMRPAPTDHPLFTSTKFSFPSPVQLQRVGTSEIALTPGPDCCFPFDREMTPFC